MKRWCALWVCLLISGCVQWPPEGYGGLAEARPTLLPLNEDERCIWLRYDKRQKELDKQLATLEQVHLRECMPAGLKQLQSQRVDIVRDMHGRLWSEVAWRQAMLAQSLQQVRLNLEKRAREGCSTDWSGLPLRQWRQT